VVFMILSRRRPIPEWKSSNNQQSQRQFRLVEKKNLSKSRLNM
jgi:hypothetical protein